jgi:hypothetical protein
LRQVHCPACQSPDECAKCAFHDKESLGQEFDTFKLT